MHSTDLKIALRGVRVHNLKNIDLVLSHRELIVFCGVSGSGKSSLALDTLFAEGQRRYIESFSTQTRQFFQQFEKPDADKIDGIPPAIAVTRGQVGANNRTTIGEATEALSYLRLLFASIGKTNCPKCDLQIDVDSTDSISKWIGRLPEKTKAMIGFRIGNQDGSTDSRSGSLTPDSTWQNSEGQIEQQLLELKEKGFIRWVHNGMSIDGSMPLTEIRKLHPELLKSKSVDVIVDRISAVPSAAQRIRDSVEVAMREGGGQSLLMVEPEKSSVIQRNFIPTDLDGRRWDRFDFSKRRICFKCDTEYEDPSPRSLNFNSPFGACQLCAGQGVIQRYDEDLIVPDLSKTIREGAIVPWETKTYQKELEKFKQVAADNSISVDVPFRELSQVQIGQIFNGIADHQYEGILGFFGRIEKKQSTSSTKTYLSRFRSAVACSGCQGKRLKKLSLVHRFGDLDIATVAQMRIDHLTEFFDGVQLSDVEAELAARLLEQIGNRIEYLCDVGLGYLTLDRPLKDLSTGEAQRVTLTAALGSQLVNMLYVLDEPTSGLHRLDVNQMIHAIEKLRDRGNSVIVVEHEPALLDVANEIVEIGPRAGDSGGEVVFQGNMEQLKKEDTLTAEFITGRRGCFLSENRKPPKQGHVKLINATGNNLKNVTVSFPLGLLCQVTGVSGAGKSSLVTETLYRAICKRKNKLLSEKPLPHEGIVGDGKIDEIILVDQTSVGRSPKSNPATYTKVFDEIRKVFAESLEARTHNYKAGHFSFNSGEGRCGSCNGDGYNLINMEFMADVFVRCKECLGTRYRKEVLRAKYRKRNISEVLDMTVREAFSFFRGQTKIQKKLKPLIDVGLEYIRLGQPANTLSSGEAQRLKLAFHLAQTTKKRSLFIMDEPTIGLHQADIIKLLDCFQNLINVGHSLIVINHNLKLMLAADYIIDVGPLAADLGGQIAGTGTPEEISELDTPTGRALKELLIEQRNRWSD